MNQSCKCISVYLGFCGSAVFIGAADVDAVVSSAAAVACIHIGAQHTTNDVAQVRNIVDIGQGTCDQDVSFACATQVKQSISNIRMVLVATNGTDK